MVCVNYIKEICQKSKELETFYFYYALRKLSSYFIYFFLKLKFSSNILFDIIKLFFSFIGISFILLGAVILDLIFAMIWFRIGFLVGFGILFFVFIIKDIFILLKIKKE
jgi:hypothetical protein